MLRIKNLTFRIGDRLLFEDASLQVPDGAKLGLVGRNGSGKTTLFKLIDGVLTPESGSVELKHGARIGQVAQEAPGTGQPILSVVLQADRERTALLAELETADDPIRIAEIHTRLTDIDAHSAEARAARILQGLGFAASEHQRPCADFSGGWRMRIALAAVLFAEPDLLLLDEPTNYLDLEGTLWLETYLARYRHTIIIISHDRDLLNTAVSGIVHLDRQGLTSYSGGYDQFDRQRQEKLVLLEKIQQKQVAQRKHMQAFVDRFRYKASKARQAQSRLKALARLQPVTGLMDSSVRPFRFASPERPLAPPILALDKVATGYDPDRPVLKNLSLRIDNDDRIGLLGQNGNGKSTFAKLLSGKLPAFSGDTTRANKLNVAYFAQHQLEELVPGDSAFDHIRRLMPDAPEAAIRAKVDMIGLPSDRMDLAARLLSGGEKARLMMGITTLAAPHLMILDEPTNHLDVDSRDALIQALNDFRGAVVLISHDRHLLEACVDRLWLVAEGTIKPFDGDLGDYRKAVLSAENGDKKKSATSQRSDNSARARRRQAAEARQKLAPLRKKIQAAEQDMKRLQATMDKLDAALADGALFTNDPDKAADLSRERAQSERRLAAVEEVWLELSEEMETAQRVG